MPLLKRFDDLEERVSEYDPCVQVIIGIIQRAYRDSRGMVGQHGHNNAIDQSVIMLDAIHYFRDGRFEHHCNLIGADPAAVLAEIKRIERRDRMTQR